MPVHVNCHEVVVHRHCPVVPSTLPIPKPELAICIARRQKLTVWTKFKAASIPRIKVSNELFFAIKFEISMLRIVNHYPIVHGLTSHILAVRVNCSGRNSMHIRLTYMFCYDWNTEFPDKNFLIIRC